MPTPLSPVQELAALREAGVTAQAEITRLTGDLNAANGLLTEAQGQVTALTGERDLAKAEAVRLTGELATANTSLAAVTGERDAAQGLLAKATKQLDNPSAEAAAICAAAGVDALAIRPGATVAGVEAGGKELLTQMAALPANEQLGFYNKNKAPIDAYRRRQSAQG